MRLISTANELQIVNFAQDLQVYRHTAEGGLESILCGSSNAAHRDVVCRPNQHDARDRSSIVLQRCECRGSNLSGIDVARVRRDQGFRCQLGDACGTGEQV